MLAPFTPPPTTTTSAVWVMGVSSSLVLLHHVPRIESVPQSIPEKVEARHSEGDRDPGEDGHPRRRGEVALRVVEHVTPARERRLDPVAEEADVGLEQDGPRHAERGRHRDDPHGVGQKMAQHDAPTRGAQAARTLHELLL